jgi:hypothetical protein
MIRIITGDCHDVAEAYLVRVDAAMAAERIRDYAPLFADVVPTYPARASGAGVPPRPGPPKRPGSDGADKLQICV